MGIRQLAKDRVGLVGVRTPLIDGIEKVTGKAKYTADLAVAGALCGRILRSPHPHARIKSINTAKAEAYPGVKGVVTAKDVVDFPLDKSVMLGIQDMRWMCRNVMAREKALFPGHPVAAVAATTEAIAAEACKLIEVDYEVLPWAIEIDDQPVPQATSATRPVPARSRAATSGRSSIQAPTWCRKCGRFIASWASMTSGP